jgi:UDP-N-acetylglucosamine--N-acetylmuramyl-(pentapeptide) pyrophosphoryl-undecaprenol N-acetylglucosamine transferase
MAGGGTGGHVIPALAVAAELRRRGHDAVFVGTRNGLEATLVPKAGFPIEWIEIGGLKGLGVARQFSTLLRLPGSVMRSRSILRTSGAKGVFSMGGYVAGPVMLAAIRAGIPIVVMEPNAMPGLVNRRLGRFVRRALLSFAEAQRYFPAGRSEITGLPVREEFFRIGWREPREKLTVLVTGGSRGARALNRDARGSWPLFAEARSPLRWIVQSGAAEAEAMQKEFAATGLEGRVTAFLDDMPAAYAEADLVISRAGAGAVAELAAAGRPSILVPFPFAADDHQTHNARAMERAGAARLIAEREFSAAVLFEAVERLRAHPEKLSAMSRAARALAKPGAASRAADLLEEFAGKR